MKVEKISELKSFPLPISHFGIVSTDGRVLLKQIVFKKGSNKKKKGNFNIIDMVMVLI